MTPPGERGTLVAESRSATLSLLVDVTSLGDDAELDHLLSFDAVDGISVETHVVVVEPAGDAPFAAIGANSAFHVSIAQLSQLRRFAAEIAARPGVEVAREVIERALTFSALADRLAIDAVVSPARYAFGSNDVGIVDISAIITVREALALIGAYARQRDPVPLGGTPARLLQRTEVYPLTAKVITPAGEAWWTACVRSRLSRSPDWLKYAGAVFKRIGQALRGRDGVHEALRVGRGRAALLDALYHLDVVLMSSVGALDALARTAHELYAPLKPNGRAFAAQEVGWQKDAWVNGVKGKADSVAAVVSRDSRLGAALRVLTRTRNSIHGIPLDEYLSVQLGGHASRVEHRVGLSLELFDQLRNACEPLGSLEALGVHTEPDGAPFLNVGVFAEALLSWTIEICGALMERMLSAGPLDGRREPAHDVRMSAVLRQRQACAAIARVGEYPLRIGPQGLPASSSLHRRVMGTIHAARSR